VWRRYPKRDSKGRIEWIHWADLELASAWAEQALRELDSFVAKYSGPTASAAQLEGGARATITTDAFVSLRSLNNAFQALNVPPIVAPESDEFGAVDLIRSFVVLTSGTVQVRTQLMLSSGRRGPSSADAMTAMWRTLGVREFASNEGVVVDVRTRRTTFRGTFDAAIAFKRNASIAERAFLALWARRPWALVRAEDETELVWSAPLVWERDRIVRKVELARPAMQSIARDPWSALVSARERVKANNDALADEWAGQMPELSSENSARQVESIRASMDALAQVRSEAALERSRAAAREGLATGAGSVAGVLAVISAAAPPAALVLAPAAAVLGAFAALAGLMLQVIPREWLATAEAVPPRLPLPYMITGDEGADDSPSHSVVPAPGSIRRAPPAAPVPTPLDPPPLPAVLTMQATAATLDAVATRAPPRMHSSAITALLDPGRGAQQPGRSLEPNPVQATPATTDGTPRRSTAATTDQPRATSSSSALVVASLGAAAATLWMLSRSR
jgi:hypothetical protein